MRLHEVKQEPFAACEAAAMIPRAVERKGYDELRIGQAPDAVETMIKPGGAADFLNMRVAVPVTIGHEWFAAPSGAVVKGDLLEAAKEGRGERAGKEVVAEKVEKKAALPVRSKADIKDGFHLGGGAGDIDASGAKEADLS